MTIQAGARFGPYEVVALIGSGGMGEVYRARDRKLNRDVALKVLPEQFALDADRLARFNREAQVLASLNHPNIAAIYGFEESNGVQALVLELVEGVTLADLLAQGSGVKAPGRAHCAKPGPSGLPLDEALSIARQIAEALEAAHEHGIVHRDLKPANIKLTADGKVKVLDFGLAKLAPGAGSEEQDPAYVLSQSPTLSAAATRTGIILGTAAYMSPEQARGKPVGKRTDIWAFGCVLYEMLTGKRAFEGEDVSDTLATILKGESDWSALPSDLPPAIRTLVRRCLAKDPTQRIADISTAHFLLAEPASLTSAVAPTPAQPTTVPRPPAWRRIAGPALALLVGSLVTGTAVWFATHPDPPSRPITRFPIVLSANDQISATGRHVVALSPDGSHLAYVANNRIYLRAMDRLEATPIRGTEAGGVARHGRNPFFSPDGQWLGFWQDGQLKKVAVSGGAAVTLCAVGQIPFGASWASDDTIVFGQGLAGIWRVPGAGGTPEVLIKVDAGQSTHGPQVLPGGHAVLFTLGSGSNWDDAEIVVQSLETGERQVLVSGGTDARYLPTGHLVYVTRGSLLAVPFDLATLKVTAGPVPLVENVMQVLTATFASTTGTAHFSVSLDGTLVYVPRQIAQVQRRMLVWVDRQGREELLPVEPRAYLYPRISPDGTRVALDVRDQENDIWIWDVARTTMTRLTFHPRLDRSPAWTPDGRYVVFSSDREGTLDVFRRAADGTGTDERLTKTSSFGVPNVVTPDGKLLVFMSREANAKTGDDLSVLSMEGDHQSKPLLHTQFSERNGDISPDGRWIAYQSSESGQDQIYVRPFPRLEDGRWQISTDGGTRPLWARDGREIFYLTPGGSVMGVSVQDRPTFSAGRPKRVFEGPYSLFSGGFNDRTYDVSPDGKRFLMIKASASSASSDAPRFIVVQNWFEELKRRVPTGN